LSQLITYKNSTISYTVYGNGPGYLLAFHGYGKTAESLSILGYRYGKKYTVISIDIFGHGNSVWNETGQPSKSDWKNCIELVLVRFNIRDKFSVFGYSIGGRPAVLTAFLFKEKVNLLWLMAATGIGGDGFYNFTVNTGAGRSLFKLFVNKPGFAIKPIKFLNSFKIIPDSLIGFVFRKIDTEEKRSLLYQRWMLLRHFGVNKKQLKKVLNSHAVKTLLVFGKKDTVVNYKTAAGFVKGLTNGKLLLPDTGHYILTDEVLGRDLVEL